MRALSTQLQDNKVIKHYDTCVILHLYYPNMWSEILSYLSKLDKQFDLIITIPYEVNISEHTIKASFPDVQIYRCENLGRDVLPFLTVFSAISKLDYKYICKIHTKQDTYTRLEINWRQDMLNKILGSRDIVAKIKKAMDNHPDWGIVAPKGYVVPNNTYWRDNAEKVINLARFFSLPTDIEFSFVAGTMFWFRPQVFSLLTNLETLALDFESEQGQEDGALSHAYERFFGMIAIYAGYKIAESDLQEVRLSDVSPIFRILVKDLENNWDAVAERDARIISLGQTINTRDIQISHLQQVLSERESFIRQIHSSISWRLTRPLRALGALFIKKSTTRRKVSVIIPVFNCRKFLKETIDSVFAQTYENWELLLVDDGSTDGSEKIAIHYAEQYPEKVKYLFHEGHQNRGGSPSRNLGFKNSRGDFILFLDQDDILLPHKLETQVPILDSHPEAAALFGETLFWYSWTNKPEDQAKDYVWDLWKAHGIHPDTIVQPPRMLDLLFRFTVMPCCAASLLSRRETINFIGGWAEEVTNIYDDQALCVKIFMNFKVYIVSGCQEKYRIHEDSLCKVYEKEGRSNQARMFFLNWAKEYLSAQGFHDAQIEQYLNNELKPY